MRRFLLAAALALVLFPVQEAAGGGWWSFIHLDRSTVAVGQRVEARAEVLFRSAAAAEEARARGQFSVYLLSGLDDTVVERAMRKASPGDWWSPGDADAIEVGRVVLELSEGNIATAHASFPLPDVPAATYALMFCDVGCTHPLADVVPARGFTVVADAATAALAERVERLETRVRRQKGELATALAAGRRLRAALVNVRAELEEIRARTPVAARRDSAPAPLWPYGGWIAAGVVAGALAVLLLRRGPTRPVPPEPMRTFPARPASGGRPGGCDRGRRRAAPRARA
jgi:hypothetical protein